jgi:hypothetical protein
MGGVPSAAAENALVDTQSMMPINNPKDRKTPLCISPSLQVNRMLDSSRPLFANSIGNEDGTEKAIHFSLSVRRVNPLAPSANSRVSSRVRP